MGRSAGVVIVALAIAACIRSPAHAQGAGETVTQALCRFIDGAAKAQNIPQGFLTRLIWRESSFRAHAVSPAGAQGVAQFMPGTAAERGLLDPFDPEQAIPEAAHLIADLRARFGDLGLAAAAYNAGPARVAAWLAGKGQLPFETQAYVRFITGREAEDWAADEKAGKPGASDLPDTDCLQQTALLRIRGPDRSDTPLAPLAPWGVQFAGAFSKAQALASFARARKLYASAIGDAQPMVIGTRLRSRGARPFYRIRAPAQTRVEAAALCQRVHAVGGACVVLRS